MTSFAITPQGIFLRSDEEMKQIKDSLPVNTYLACVTPLGEYYLKTAEPFTRPKKKYGTVDQKADRILATFNDRPASTGILLSGEQGSGKTMLARELSLMGIDQGISTIIVNQPFSGSGFNTFIQSIDFPAIVLIDEFEKMYDDDGQEALLTLLDGLFPTKKLFVLTCNNVYRIDQHMLNRPGRLFYHLKYVGLDAAFVQEYAEDVLFDQGQVEPLVNYSRMFYAFNFDMLKAIVEEMNRFSMNVASACEMLNITPVDSNEVYYDYELFLNDKKVHEGEWHGNPLNEKINISFYSVEMDDDNDDEDAPKRGKTKEKKDPVSFDAAKQSRRGPHGGHFELAFDVDKLNGIADGVYTFIHGNTKIMLARRKPKAFDRFAF